MTKHVLSSANDATTAPFDNDQNTLQIAVIGGGLTGLLTATLLERVFSALSTQHDNEEAAHRVSAQMTVFEKSRSVGRLATRYSANTDNNKNWQWAFGAQFFTAKSDNFSQFIQPWLDSELLQPWCAEVVELTPANDYNKQPVINKKEQWDSRHARYISTPKMTSWGRALADNLSQTTIIFKTRVAPLNESQYDAKNRKTQLFDENGASLGHFDWVICTAPNVQAVDLMVDSGFTEQAQITRPKMQACYTLMLGWDNIDVLPESLKNDNMPAWDVAYMQDSILDRVFIEHHKPMHDNLLPSVTIHARNDWSEVNVDDDLDAIQGQLLAAAQQALNWNDDTAPSQVDCHRWRYAATIVDKTTEELGVLVDKSHNWIVSGDWCGQGNIESCYRMAEQTVKTINLNNIDDTK